MFSEMTKFKHNGTTLSSFLFEGEPLYLFHFNNTKNLFPDISKIKTLEAGCRTAYFSIPYAILGAEVYCIDNSKEELQSGIDVFDKYKLNGNFALSDAMDTGYPDDHFDLVFNMGVLEHFDKEGQDRMVKEMARVSKKHIYISAPNIYHRKARDEIKEAQYRMENDIGPEWDKFYKPMNVFGLKEMVERNGLMVNGLFGSAHQLHRIPVLGTIFKKILGPLLGYEICVLASK